MKLKNIKSILAVALCAVGLAAFADGTGTNDDPWLVGYPTQMNVGVWTNGTGRLDIDGEGAMMGFSASSPAPWKDAAVTECVVGSNVTAIGASAFRSCPNLKTLVLNEQTPPTLGANNVFAGVKIFVPAGKADAYRASEGWKAYEDAIEEMRSVKGKELTKHLYEMTYSWWDAVKANDIGEMLAAYMAQPDQLAENGMSVPHAIPAWFGELQGAVLCTSCRNGNFIGRNFDWGYDDVDECVMHIPAAEGRLASVGVVSWFFPQWMQDAFDVDSFLPELTMDGINEKGVAINVNVVPGGDNGWTTGTNSNATKRLCAGFAVRTVLDNATNAAHAVEILQSRNIYSLQPLEFHWMISDKDESYVVECVSNALVVLKAKDARPKMSNYYVTHSPSVGEYDVLANPELTRTFHTPRAMGIERYANVSNGLESVDSVNAMFTHMTNVWYKLKYLPGNEQKYWSDMNGAPIPDQSGTFTAFDGPELNEARSNAFKQIQANYVAVTNYEAHHEGSRTIDHDECPELTNGVVHTVHTSIYDIEKRKLRVVVQEDAARAFNVYLTPPPPVEALSNKFALDLTAGDRVAKDVETLVVDPAWDETDPSLAKVFIDGEEEPRQYTVATNDTWETAALEPGRYELEMQTSCSSYPAGFWKVGDDWVVFDSSNITADVTFEAGKTYLFFGTNTADGVTLKVEDGAKFAYDKGAPAGFKGGTVTMSKRYETKTVGDLYQIVEKIKGCEDNPWEIGEGVEAYTNGTELVIGGAGTVGALSGVDGLKDLLAGLTAINVTSNGVTGAEAQAFADVGTDGGSVSLTLPDGWQGELPDEDGNWYGAKGVTLTAYPLAVKNVTFQQRYPWNGLVDITCDLTGAGKVTLNATALTNGVAFCEAMTLVGKTTIDLGTPGCATNGVRLVWDAAADLPAGFKVGDISIEMAVEKMLPGQLWKGGPIWAECNVGADKPTEYGILTNFEGAAQAVTDAMGAEWRVPTAEDFTNLVNNCNHSWTNNYNNTGKNGCLVTSKVDPSKFIFMPAAGFIHHGTTYDSSGTEGYYWSSSPNAASSSCASSIKFREEKSTYVTDSQDRAFRMSVRAVQDTPPLPPVSAKSAAGTVDLRTAVALAEGETTISNVTWSATLWGELDEEFVTAIGWTNLTTGATGVFSNLARVVGEAAEDADLPQKDGEYLLTHSTGELKSFVTFTVSGYPLGCETNPWIVGAGDNPENVVAWTDGNGNVYFKPARSAVSREGLDAVTNAMGGASFPAKLISEDGSEANDLVMVLGASGTVYDTIAEALYADEASCTLFDVNGYLVSYNGGEGALGTMATDTFIPTVPTNLTANAYEIIGYRFDGWTNAVAGVFYTNRQEGVDFAQPGETLALTALWTQVGVEPVGYTDLADKLAKVTRPVTFDLVRDIEIPVGGKITVPAGKDVTFAGIGKFDVTAERPALFDGYPVGTGLKPEDLGRFVTDKDVKAYYEDGKVVVRGRGETEEFPWLLGTEGHENEVTAWAIDGGILAKPARGTASVAALQSVTNALSGYVPGPGELKVISADGSATNDVVMLLGSDGVVYDTLADVLAADPLPETVELFEVNGCIVNYDGNGAAGEMASETFLPGISTNLAANAFTAAGYAFEGWTTNGAGGRIVFADRAAIADPQAGDIYDLKAVWTPVPTTVGSYDDLKKVLDQAAKIGKPVEIVLNGTITPPADEALVLPTTVDVQFSGDGKIGGLVFKEGVDWFADSIAEHSDVFAYVDPSLTNIAGLVICNGLLDENRPIDLAALADAMEKAKYQPAVMPLNALVATGDGTEKKMPAKWVDQDGNTYKTLQDAIDVPGAKTVTPDFGSEEKPVPPQVIVEEVEVEVEPGVTKIVTATMKNKGGDVPGAIQSIGVGGLAELAEEVESNMVVEVTASASSPVANDLRAAALADMARDGRETKGAPASHYVDFSLFIDEQGCAPVQIHEPGRTLAVTNPWTFMANHGYKFVRKHDGKTKVFSETADEDGEYVELDKANGLVIVNTKFFSPYGGFDFELTTVRITVPAAGSLPKNVQSVTVKADGKVIQPATTAGGVSTYEIDVGVPVEVVATAKPGYGFAPDGARTKTLASGKPGDDVSVTAEELASDIVKTDPGSYLVYDFTAKVKTTGSKKVNGGKVTNYTVNLGKNKKGEFWYTAPCIWDGSQDKHVDITTLTGKTSRKFAVKGASGTVYKQVLSVTYKSKTSSKLKNPPELLVDGLNDEAKADIAAAFGFDGKKTSYAEKSAGVYCQTFGYADETPSVCYRVAETRTITGTYVLWGSSADGALFVEEDGVLPDLSATMLFRFGALTLEKSKNVELVGEIGSDETVPYFCLAGQGELKTLKDARKRTVEGISTLNGNIVGRIGAPTCETCCTDMDSIAWDCDGSLIDGSEEEKSVTAAFGTFSLKFSSKKSSFAAPVK